MTKRELNPLATRSFQLYDWISKRLNDLEIPKDRKILIGVCCFDTAIEHQLAIATLVQSHVYGSAFALVRSTFESFVRGVWLSRCATEDEIDDYVSDKIDLKFYKILNDIEKLEGFRNGVLSKIKTDAWKVMNSYTHSGIEQASRRLTSNAIEPNYSNVEILSLLRIADAFAILSFQQSVSDAGRLDLAAEAQNKLLEIIKPQ
jgi:hypothetical protein